MALSRERVKGRKERPRAFAVHHHVVRTEAWARLSPYAKVLWIEIGLEFMPASQDGRRPGNNGWLACPYNYLVKERGFKSRSTIKEALRELEWFGFIETTLPGQFPKTPARYALTHLDIDQHPDNAVMARRAPHTYRKHDGSPFPRRSRKKNPTVPQASPLGTHGGTKKRNDSKPSPASGTGAKERKTA